MPEVVLIAHARRLAAVRDRGRSTAIGVRSRLRLVAVGAMEMRAHALIRGDSTERGPGAAGCEAGASPPLMRRAFARHDLARR